VARKFKLYFRRMNEVDAPTAGLSIATNEEEADRESINCQGHYLVYGARFPIAVAIKKRNDPGPVLASWFSGRGKRPT